MGVIYDYLSSHPGFFCYPPFSHASLKLRMKTQLVE